MNEILTLQAGGTLNPRRHVYIERPVDDRLFALLCEGRYVNVLSSRQMGKSSLMVRTAHRLVAEGVRVVVIDLAGEIGVAESADAYYLGLLNKINRNLKLSQPLEPWWKSLVAETANQRLLRFFRELTAKAVTGSLIIFLDEIDSTLRFPFTDGLFTAIRGMYNERGLVQAYERITFCLVGVATPNELIKDRRTTSYNVGETLELGDFDPRRDDLTPLERALSADPATGRNLLDRTLSWTGGHPYLTVKLATELRAAGIATAQEVDRLVEESYGSLGQAQTDVHFQQILRFLETRLSTGLVAYQLYRRVFDGKREQDLQTLAHAELKLSGLVKRDAEGCLVVRCRIYRRLFDRRWLAQVAPVRAVVRYRRLAIAAGVLLLIVTGGATYYQLAIVEPELRMLRNAPPPPPDKLTYLSVEDTDPSQRQINDRLFSLFQKVTGTRLNVIHEDPINKIEQILNGDYDIALLNDIVLLDQFDEHLSSTAFLDLGDNQFALTNRAGAYFWTDWHDVGLLYYRKDLVGNAPQTWEDLEQKALHIQNSQQNDTPEFVAFAWPGNARDKYEGLTCTALEWIVSN